MARERNEIVDRYIDEVKEKIVCPKGTRKLFLSQLREQVTSYADERKNVALGGLYKEFGHPDVFASDFLSSAEYEAMLKKAKKRLIVLSIVAFVLIAVIAFLIAFVIRLINKLGYTITVTDATVVNTYAIVRRLIS